jgi:urea transporter/murein DD-endopeptidase MepM/ murein hydrolase activator NlpD
MWKNKMFGIGMKRRSFPFGEREGVWGFISFSKFIGEATLNSYGMLFFSKNKVFSLFILLVSFFTPFTGACGLAALLVALIASAALGFGKEQIKNGLLTYSVILFGLGFGTNFEMGTAFVILLVVGTLLTLFLSVVLNAILNKKGLPALSLAFIISTAIIIVASKSFEGIGLTHRRIYWFNEMYALGGSTLVNTIQQIENWKMPEYVAGFFRSMSAILFQVNIAAGIILTIGLLIYSRIGLLLMILGYTVAILFSYAMGGFQQSDLTYYNMGTNFMLVAVALGGFYLIPSIRSFLWVFITVPIAYLLVVGVGSLLFKIGVPVFSLPFCLVVILFLYVLQLRSTPGKLALTPIQYYSPEQNLYRYLNGKERMLNKFYFHLYLPVMGEWMLSQGHDGSMTHKGEWSKALDFVLLDDEMKTYQSPGNLPEHFYCYNKPVLAPADGIVQEIIDHVEDNEIGKNNTAQNWGNTIVIKHAEGLYTKLSHLKKHSFKTVKGAYVKRGDIVASCGNSGRSPEPHLHMQVQATPYIGSKTLNYPIAYFNTRKGSEIELQNFAVPTEGSFVSNVLTNTQLQQAFNFQPGYCLTVNAEGYATEEWETVTSFYNEPYLYCRKHNAFAYFINNGTAFYFTNYFGPKNTLLYQFYLCAYKVLLSSDKAITVKDNYPIDVFGINPARWLQDLISPFYIFIKMKFEGNVASSQDMLGSGTIHCSSKQVQQLFGWPTNKQQFEMEITNGQIQSFTSISNNKKIQATCTVEN